MIPSRVEQIDESAFSSCDYLKSIEFGENSELKIIGENAFSTLIMRFLPKFYWVIVFLTLPIG